MLTLNAVETARILPYQALIEELRSVLRDRRSDEAWVPLRLSVPLPSGAQLLVMPAADRDLVVTKLVTVHPNNPGAGLPMIQAEVIVIDASNGKRLFLLEGETLTARRTAALSVLAAQLLAPALNGPLLIMGAGVQAQAHLEAFVEVLGVRDVAIASRTQPHAFRLAQHGERLGASCTVVTDLWSVARHASLIVTATSSTTPVLPAEIDDGAFVAAVGSHHARAAELPVELIQRARLFVDTLEGAKQEAGDLIQARVNWATVTPLEEAIDAPHQTAGPVVFKSVGDGLWDLAAARLVDHQLTKRTGAAQYAGS